VFALPGDAADAAAAVKCANNASLPWVVRGGGHSYEGASLMDDAAVIDTANLIDIKIDAAASTMVVGAGQRLGPIYVALSDKGLYIAAGTCGGVGISGLILGGGIGHATRAAGITSDAVTSAKVGGCGAGGLLSAVHGAS
jgi:FAD/FMN-containing dehydrogenase